MEDETPLALVEAVLNTRNAVWVKENRTRKN